MLIASEKMRRFLSSRARFLKKSYGKKNRESRGKPLKFQNPCGKKKFETVKHKLKT